MGKVNKLKRRVDTQSAILIKAIDNILSFT